MCWHKERVDASSEIETRTLRFHFMYNDMIDITMEAKRVDGLKWMLEIFMTIIGNYFQLNIMGLIVQV